MKHGACIAFGSHDVLSGGGFIQDGGVTIPNENGAQPDEGMAKSAAPRSPRDTTRNRLIRRVLIPLALIACLAGFVVNAIAADTDGTDIAVTSNEALDGLVPSRGAEILSQDVVGVDLALGWDASLTVNGTAIPPAQTIHEPARNWVFFRPGPDQVLTQLNENTNCVEAVFWRTTESPEQARNPVRWCFEVT